MAVLNVKKHNEPFVTADQAGQYLGYSAVTMRRLAKAGTVPAVAFPSSGRRMNWRFRLSELDDYVLRLGRDRVDEEKRKLDTK